MSRRNKLAKFAELSTLPNVYENFANDDKLSGQGGIPVDLKDQWGDQHFGNDHPIVLELACGRGEYTLGLSRMYPEKNFIGVDIKGARIWKGAKTAIAEQLNNAAFLRTRIEQIEYFIAPGEVSEIWITFPDPFLRKGKSNRRLTAPRFLDKYRSLLQENGSVHLKTDSPELYEFTLETLSTYPHAELQYEDDNIYAKPLPLPELAFETYYERMHLAAQKTIKYIRFGFEKIKPAAS